MTESTEAEGNRAPDGSGAFDGYEIAQPESYPAFSIPAAAPETAGAGAAAPAIAAAEFAPRIVPVEAPAGPYAETWDDRDTTAPGAADKPSFLSSHLKRMKDKEGRGVREKRAVWIVHGMGQQIPFETVDSLTQGLLSVASPKGVTPRLRTVKRIGRRRRRAWRNCRTS
jgi:hypothetical protein